MHSACNSVSCICWLYVRQSHKTYFPAPVCTQRDGVAVRAGAARYLGGLCQHHRGQRVHAHHLIVRHQLCVRLRHSTPQLFGPMP